MTAGNRTAGSPADIRIRVALVDDHTLLRGSLRALLDREPDMDVVGEAGDGATAVDVVRAERPDVVLMDMRMPGTDGVAATRSILADPDMAARTRVLALSMYDVDELVFDALEAGASGFLLKDSPPTELLRGIRLTATGDAVLSPALTLRLIEQFTRGTRSAPDGQLGQLTERELEVLTLIGRGLSNHELADRLHIARPTVKTHVGRLLTKLGARDRVALVIIAHRNGLVS